MIKHFHLTYTDGILTGTTTPGQSGPGGNGNEGVFHIPWTGVSPSDAV